jgi:hypothetical protein
VQLSLPHPDSLSMDERGFDVIDDDQPALAADRSGTVHAVWSIGRGRAGPAGSLRNPDWLQRIRKEPQGLAAFPAQHGEITAIQREDGVDPFLFGEVQKRQVGKLRAEAAIPLRRRCDPLQGILGQGQNLEDSQAWSRIQFLQRPRQVAKQPRGFGQHRPARPKGWADSSQRLDAPAMMDVVTPEQGNQWARIDQHARGDPIFSHAQSLPGTPD